MLLSLVGFISGKEPTCEFDCSIVSKYFIHWNGSVLLTQVALLFPLFASLNGRRIHSSESKSRLDINASYIYLLLTVTSVLSGLVTIYRLPSSSLQPFRPGPRIVRAGIWTVHFGFDNEGHDSQRGIRNLLRDMELDIVGLLETDLHVCVPGRRCPLFTKCAILAYCFWSP